MDHRSYKECAQQAAKQTTKFLKDLGIEQKEIAQKMGISFSYLEMMLRGAKPLLPQHAIKLQDVTLGAIACRHRGLTRLQVALLADASEAWGDATTAWRRNGERGNSDTGVLALFQAREQDFTKLVEEGLNGPLMFPRPSRVWDHEEERDQMRLNPTTARKHESDR